MKRLWNVLAWLTLLAVTSGCTGTERQPECRGPWTPVNVAREGGHG
jgi:hypothetical protein